MQKLNRIQAALLCAELVSVAFPSLATTNSQIYNDNINTTDAVAIEIDTSGAIFGESSSGRYAGIGAYITDDRTEGNSLPSYTITAGGITVEGATESNYRLYGLAAYYASLNVDSGVGITLSLGGNSTGQLRAIRNNYYGTITIGGDVTAKLTNTSSSSRSATYGFDNWGYATTVDGNVNMEISSDYTSIFGVYSQANYDYVPSTVFNKDFTLTITAGENNASEVDGVYSCISTAEFNGTTTITVEDKYSGDASSAGVVNSVVLLCDNDETEIKFNGDSTCLTSTTVAKDNYGVTASGPYGSINFNGQTVTVSSSSSSGLALGLNAQYGGTISASKNTALTVKASSTSGDAIAVLADYYYGNGSIASAGATYLAASSASGNAFGVYNYGEENANTGSGSVTLTGEAGITVATESGYAFGVYAYGDAETALSGEKITIAATAGDGVSYGVYAEGGADVAVGTSGSSVSVSADCAIYAESATVTLTAYEAALEGDVYAGPGGEITLTAEAAKLDGSLYAYGGTIAVDVADLTFEDGACIKVASVTDEEDSVSYDGTVSVATESAVSNVTISGNVVATADGFAVTSADDAIEEATAITFAGSVSVDGTIAGDEITIAGVDNSATSISFSSLAFDLTEMKDGAVMLTVGSAVDLNGLKVGVANANASDLAPGDALTLMYDEQGISNFESATVSAGGTLVYTLSGLSDSCLTGEYGYSVYLDDAETSLIVSAGTDISVTDVVLSLFSAESEGSAAASTLSLEWGASALLELESDLAYDFSVAGLETPVSVSVLGVSQTLLAAGDSMQLIDGAKAVVSGLASLVSSSLEGSALSSLYNYEPAAGVTVAGSAVYVGTDTDAATEGGLALSVSSIDSITFGEIAYSDSALVTLDPDKAYDLSETAIDVSGLTIVDSEGEAVSVTYDYSEITGGGTVFMTLISSGEDTGLSANEKTSLSFGYTLTNGENYLAGAMEGIVAVKDYCLVLAADSNVAVSELTLDISNIEWNSGALLTLNDSLSYDFASASVSGLDETAIPTSSFLDVYASTTLIDTASAEVSGLATLEGIGGSYSYSLLDGVVKVTGSGSVTVSSGNVDYTIASIDTLDFYITSDTASGSTILTVATADLSGTAVTAYAEGGSYLTDGYEVTLLEAKGGLTTDADTSYSVTITEGVSVEYDVDIYQDGDSIVAVVAGDDTEDDSSDTDTDDTDSGDSSDEYTEEGYSSGSSLRSETKSLVETRLAQLAMLEQGADLLANAVSDKTALAASREGWEPFAAVSRSSYKYATGSYVDIDGFNATVGVMKTDTTPYGSLTYGAAFQYGSGEYESHAEGVRASGDTEYTGGSLFARHQWHSGAYAELCLSKGTTEGDYKSSEILDGVSCSYKDDAPYWGAGFAVGRELSFSDAKSLDVYARCFYSHIGDASARLSTGETYDFDSTDSSRLRLGARYTHDLSRQSSYYAGVAYEYQFDGSARGTYNGMSTLSPSLEGSSGMLEAGLRFAPQGSNLTVDLDVTGWAGTRKGVEGKLMFRTSF